MARNPRRPLPVNPHIDNQAMPESLSNKEFGRRLLQRMNAKRWLQSDLARAAFGEDAKGLPAKRDSVSNYVRGKTRPDTKNLRLLAEALDTTPEELYPDHHAAAMGAASPSFLLRQVHGARQDRIWVLLDQEMSAEAAAEIHSIVVRDAKMKREEG